MEFRILGPVEVAGSGSPIRLGSRRERAVLAALVLGAGEVVSADRLIDALWGDEPPRSAAKTLQNYVLKLRKALGPAAIETQSPGYRLAIEAAAIDARRFDALVRAGAEARGHGRPDDAVKLLREALGLWRGVPLEELDGWNVAEAEANRLNELRRVAAEELVDAELACGRAASAVAELEAMVAAEPLRERRWAMLMLALYRCGRQADALRTYQRARTLLGEELGIEPGTELRALERGIAEQDPSLDLVADLADPEGDDVADDALACPPYQGLAAFEPEDHARFFGRAALVADLVTRAGRARFVAVVGASGSGKSSVVRAGVLANVRDGALPGSETWPSFVMTPGSHPLAELAAGVARVTSTKTSEVLDRLEHDAHALTSGERLVIVVDQLEELFTQTRDDTECRRFIAAIAAAVGDAGSPVTVIAALRADFYGHAGAHPELAALLDDGSSLLCPMEPDEIRAAIEGPAELAGLRVQPGLTELIVRDVGDEPGALPLLSHALLETWKRRTHRTLTVAGYRAAGGARGAIAQTAESVYDRLDPPGRKAMRQILLRLTELGEGTEDTSRRVDRRELGVSVHDPAGTERVLQLLAEARLVSLDAATAQVAHEALIRAWPRLRSWLDEDRAGHRLHRHLTHAAQDWESLGRDPSELYRGPRLATASEWLARDDHVEELNALEHEFVQASTAREDADRNAVQEQALARERSNRNLRRLLIATAVVLAVALVAGTLAVVQRNRADDEASRARGSSETADVTRLVAQSDSLNHTNVFVGALLAVEANRLRNDAQTQGAMLSSVVADPRRSRTLPTGTSEGVWMVPGSPSVLVLSHGRLGVWDTRSGAHLAELDVTRVQTAAVRNDGLIAAARDDGSVRFFTSDGRRAGADISSGMSGAVANIDFSPDGSELALAYGNWADPTLVQGNRTVRLYRVADRLPGPQILGPIASVTALAFSRDGRNLVVGSGDDRVLLVDVATGNTVRRVFDAPAPVIGLASDPRPRSDRGGHHPGRRQRRRSHEHDGDRARRRCGRRPPCVRPRRERARAGRQRTGPSLRRRIADSGAQCARAGHVLANAHRRASRCPEHPGAGRLHAGRHTGDRRPLRPGHRLGHEGGHLPRSGRAGRADVRLPDGRRKADRRARCRGFGEPPGRTYVRAARSGADPRSR